MEERMNAMETDLPILTLHQVSKAFRQGEKTIQAVQNVSFSIAPGECVGIIGESGSGKSTIANLIAGFEKPDEGEIYFAGQRLLPGFHKKAIALRSGMRMAFQSPEKSFHPKSKVLDAVCDGLRYSGAYTEAEMKALASESLRRVNIPAEMEHRYCRELSGGECQRVALARAIVSKPQLLINDEITSALDVSTQARILQLLASLKQDLQAAFLFITHDITVAAYLCDRILVLHHGTIIEEGTPTNLLKNAKDPYTQLLFQSVLTL